MACLEQTQAGSISNGFRLLKHALHVCCRANQRWLIDVPTALADRVSLPPLSNQQSASPGSDSPLPPHGCGVMFVGRAALKTAGGAVKDASTAAGGAAKRSVAKAAQTAQQTVKAAMAKAGATARQRRSTAAADRAATTTIEEMTETPVEMEPIWGCVRRQVAARAKAWSRAAGALGDEGQGRKVLTSHPLKP